MGKTTVYLHESQLEKLRLLSEATGAPMAHYIRMAINTVLQKHEGKLDGQTWGEAHTLAVRKEEVRGPINTNRGGLDK
jgi:hypothetical protein